MQSGSSRRPPPLTVVGGGVIGGTSAASAVKPRDVDWSILMAQAQAGDATAYRRLLKRITPYLRFLASRRNTDPHDNEDAVQDILLTLHAVRHTYDPARPLGPWLTAIAQRRLIDRLRAQSRRRSREIPLTVKHETFAGDQMNIHEDLSGQRELHAAVLNLPPGQSQAIQLLKLKEMSLKEAAEISGVSVAALKVATHRALQALRKMLVREEPGR